MNYDSLKNQQLKPTDFDKDLLATSGITQLMANANKQSQRLKLGLAVAMVAVVLLLLPGTLSSFSWGGLIFTVAVIAVLMVASLVITSYDQKNSIKILTYQLSLLGFARDNNLSLRQQSGMWLNSNDLPLSFRQGVQQKLTDVLVGANDSFMAGHYQYDIRQSSELDTKDYRTVHNEFAMYRLTKSLPRLCVASVDVYRKNESLVRVQLEGNFNNRFYVYTVPGAERLAFEILTPDVMASMINNGGDYNIEIVGNRLYVIKENLRIVSGGQLANFIERANTIAGQVAEQVNGRSVDSLNKPVNSTNPMV